ncbi:MAG TPA: hypothetical protein VFY79_12910, partial [Dehalococcoidia bacterium]|nr:hypothetical protein [Dehalococcoidia bacterium]
MAGSYWDKVTAQRVSRRRVLQSAGVAGAAAGAVWIVGCGGGSSSNNNSTPGSGGPSGSSTETAPQEGLHFQNPNGTPKAGGTYNIATSVDFDTFDPHISIAGGVAYFPKLYNTVVNRSPVDNSFEFDDMAE